MQLSEFNVAPDDAVDAVLVACCDAPSWVAAVRDGRPYGDLDDAIAISDATARALSAAEVDQALSAHPRIGERATSERVDAAWSRDEQSGVSADADVQGALRDANQAYEERFDRVFLICATGLSGEQILGSLRARLDNDEATEAAVVADELRKIANLRLRKALTP